MGCQSVLSITVTEPSTPLALSINSSNNVSCYGGNDGMAIASANGGTPGYTYIWNTTPNQYNDSAVNLSAGTYTCEVFDAKGCYASSLVDIDQPQNPLSLNLQSLQDVGCFGDNTGSASISVTGGTPAYNYTWSNNPSFISDSIFNLAAGTHTCYVQDANACEDSISIIISQPQQALGINIVNQQNVNCYGDSTASIEVQANGGSPAYNYIWNNDSTELTSTINNIAAGQYDVLVTDSKGCTELLSINIGQPNAALVLGLDQVTPILCHNDANGEIEVSAQGGTPNYTYNWLNSSTLTGNNITGLDAQNYIGVVTDDLGCTDTLEVPLDNPILLEATINADTALCFGASIDVVATPTGGTGTYNYAWTPNLSTSSTLSDIPNIDQVYTCTITDDNNCSTTVSTLVIVHYTNPDDIEANADELLVCEFDSVQLSYTFAGSTIDMDIEWLHCPTCDPNQDLWAQIVSDTMFIISATNQCNQTVYDTVFVNYNEVPVVDIFLNSDSICEFNDLSFFNYAPNNPNWTYNWDFGNGITSNEMSPVVNFGFNGVYDISLSITDQNGCVSLDTASAQIVVHPQAIAGFTIDPGNTSTMDDPVFNFTNTSIHANEFLWSFGDQNYSFLEHPINMYDQYGDYTVILSVNNEFNCPDTTMQIITIKATHGVYVPNTFTPDGDDFNNDFLAVTYGLKNEGFQMLIFDRWGEVIFESFDVREGWDGTYKGYPSKDGVYTWVIYYKTLDNQTHKLVGHVTLLR